MGFFESSSNALVACCSISLRVSSESLLVNWFSSYIAINDNNECALDIVLSNSTACSHKSLAFSSSRSLWSVGFLTLKICNAFK